VQAVWLAGLVIRENTVWFAGRTACAVLTT
jgi:hypothetical protein